MTAERLRAVVGPLCAVFLAGSFSACANQTSKEGTGDFEIASGVQPGSERQAELHFHDGITETQARRQEWEELAQELNELAQLRGKAKVDNDEEDAAVDALTDRMIELTPGLTFGPPPRRHDAPTGTQLKTLDDLKKQYDLTQPSQAEAYRMKVVEVVGHE